MGDPIEQEQQELDQNPLFKVAPGEAGHKPKQPIFDMPKKGDVLEDEEETEQVKAVDPEKTKDKVASPDLQIIQDDRQEREALYRK